MAAAASAADAASALPPLPSLLAALALAWYAAIWCISLLGLHTARRLYSPPIPASPLSSLADDVQRAAANGTPAQTCGASASPSAPGVSILRPLAGLDHNLLGNLCAAFEQRYPRDSFEIILSVRDEHDQALAVARDVAARYPEVKSRIVVGDETAGVNPKINNLVVPYSLAAFDILWVLDAQCSLSPTALGRAVDALVRSPPAVPSPRFLRRLPLFGGATYARGSTARVGLVHHVPLAVSPSANLGSQVERAFLSTNHAKMYLAINTLSVDSCVMGKSNLFCKSDLARVPDAFFGVDEQGTSGEAGAIGSSAFAATASTEGVASGAARPLARFSIYLAEDNMLALSLMRPPLGLHHALAPGDAVHTSVGGISSLRAYASRRMRWIRVRKRMVLAATLLEPITESIVAGLLAAWGLRRLVLAPRELGGTAEACALAAFLAAHHVLWYNVDYGVMLALRAGTPLPPSERGVFRIAYAVRELLALPIWVGAMCGNTVTWREQRFRILPSGRAAHAEPAARWRRGGYERIRGEEDERAA
ncbi:hypothetical protein FA09DRAFT_327494 [Tilletiopsis washingtonensis]|uniref:Ceramide glucosyltransferase n=1 Tax=Tilletiopsis washingtonensis TaxID=58919 RepID=A0A316ZHM0_9BASI|nr:hypothetical protein FA09DRAFT_327494 [Tilletiopsis washingtonensis]PWO00767.1 hypothetical protein FA09DRAFT_327494 [Tilletiopsis washingtonensis]